MYKYIKEVSVFVLIPLFVIFALFYTIISGSKAPAGEGSALGARSETSANQQLIEIKAKGGYSPSIINADANKDTVLRVLTDNTFDCSSAVVIPSLGIREHLQPTSTKDIALGSHPAGSSLSGTCSMGMYSFTVNFN